MKLFFLLLLLIPIVESTGAVSTAATTKDTLTVNPPDQTYNITIGMGGCEAIIFNETEYAHNVTVQYPRGNYTTHPIFGKFGWCPDYILNDFHPVFLRWNTTGSITATNSESYTTKIEVNGAGTLEANYTYVQNPSTTFTSTIMLLSSCSPFPALYLFRRRRSRLAFHRGKESRDAIN